MRLPQQPSSQRGIALILVLISVIVLAVLAAGFAWAMRVEVKLARNANCERELEWLGRSGVEVGRWVLCQQAQIGAERYDGLNQVWAGGPGGPATSNSPLAGFRMEDIELGGGRFSVKIVDCDRKMNINMVTPPMLEQALLLTGMDAAGAQTVIGSLQDWMDTDPGTHVDGAESDFYEQNTPKYEAKDGPVDDISELLLVKGITPDLLWGPSNTNRMLAAFQAKTPEGQRWLAGDLPGISVGLADLFTPVSGGKININTASASVLQMIPFMDEATAQEVLRIRAGMDGQDGTDDDTPFNNVGELMNAIPNRQTVQFMMQFCDVRSRIFEVTVDAEINGYKRRFVALVARENPRLAPILTFTAR